MVLLQPGGVTEAGQASWGGRLWLRGEEGAPQTPLGAQDGEQKGKGLLVMLELTNLELKLQQLISEGAELYSVVFPRF